jgi:hypothetical protein
MKDADKLGFAMPYTQSLSAYLPSYGKIPA